MSDIQLIIGLKFLSDLWFDFCCNWIYDSAFTVKHEFSNKWSINHYSLAQPQPTSVDIVRRFLNCQKVGRPFFFLFFLWSECVKIVNHSLKDISGFAAKTLDRLGSRCRQGGEERSSQHRPCRTQRRTNSSSCQLPTGGGGSTGRG